MKSFPRRGAAAVDRAVKPADVVPTLDVVEHRRVQSLAGRPGSGLDQFTLERGTEGLGHGVLPGTHIRTTVSLRSKSLATWPIQLAKDLGATVDSVRRVRSNTQPPSRRSANERT